MGGQAHVTNAMCSVVSINLTIKLIMKSLPSKLPRPNRCAQWPAAHLDSSIGVQQYYNLFKSWWSSCALLLLTSFSNYHLKVTDDGALMTTFFESEWFWVSTHSVLAVPRKECSTGESRALLGRPPSGTQSILETLHWESFGTGMKSEDSLCAWAWSLQECQGAGTSFGQLLQQFVMQVAREQCFCFCHCCCFFPWNSI